MFRGVVSFAALLLVVLTVFSTGTVLAETVTSAQAEVVAQNWLTVLVDQEGGWVGDKDAHVAEVQSITQDGLVVGYCANVKPQGYIIVSALKEMIPIKAYSDESSFTFHADGGASAMIQENLARLAEDFISRYGSLDVAQPLSGDLIFIPGQKQKWDRLLVDPVVFKQTLSLKSDEKIDSVGPLMTSSWDQTGPYNNSCPMGDGSRTLVGCVATAAAQIMKYHEWPEYGIGSHSYYWNGDDSCEGSSPGGTQYVVLSDSYDWDNIYDEVSYGDPIEVQNATAEINYEVGVCYHMDYGACASGSYLENTSSVFTNYFRYKTGIDAERRYMHTAESWFAMIKDEINLGRPMLYGITAHAIVCDGWRDVYGFDQYHINYGWDDGHNTWYSVDNIYGSESGETVYRYIIPMRSGWDDGTGGVLTNAESAQGSCWFDLDGDDDADLVLVNDSQLVLLLNDGTGEFTDVSANLPSGLSAGRDIAAGDYDKDGDLDLYLVRHGLSNVLLNNDGGIFTDVTSGLLADAGLGTSVSWMDFNKDGALDLLLTNSDGGTHPNRLLLNDGGGVFSNAPCAALTAHLGTQSAVWCDVDDDGDSDLYLTSSSSANLMLSGDGNGGFVDITAGLLGDTGVGMDASWGDYDGDDDPDLYLVNQGSNMLLRNDGASFTDVTASGPLMNGDDGLNSVWFDKDNDGDLDIYLCNAGSDNVLLENLGDGTFDLADEGLVAGGSGSAACSVADYDNDGDLDIYLANSGANTLLKNEHWSDNQITVKLSGSISNSQGYGTKVRMANSDFSLTRWISTKQDGYFGLGLYTTADTLEVTWPTGKVVTFTNLESGLLEIMEAPFVEVTSGPVSDAGDARGVSWIDYDDDGDQDLYVVNHGTANALLRNDGNSVFTSVGGALADAGAGNGAAWADYDGDGDLDVYLSNGDDQDNILFNNDGTGTFSVASAYGLSTGGDSFGVSWVDFNLDQILDLYVVNHDSANNLCRGHGDIGGGTWLFMAETILADDGPGSMGVWADYNGDSWPDLFLACEAPTDKLFANYGSGVFVDETGSDVPVYYGTSRGASWADYDNDGDLDLYVANDGQPDRLCQNTDGYLLEVTGGALHYSGNARNVAWGDYDNDADLDAYITRYNQPDLLLRNDGGGVFSHAMTTYGDSGPLSNGMAWADFDGDGFLDVYLAMDGANVLLTNEVQNDNHWFHVDLTATGANTGAIGSRIRAVTGELSQLRVISAGSGYMCMDSHTVEFGLAQATVLDSLVINWPDGEVTVWTNLSVDQKMAITQGEGPSPVADLAQLPTSFGLGKAYPNPFNPNTKISFDLPQDRHVTLNVYDISGALVATLVNETRPAGSYEVMWNGQNSHGQPVASGTYFFQMKAGEFSNTRKAVLLK